MPNILEKLLNCKELLDESSFGFGELLLRFFENCLRSWGSCPWELWKMSGGVFWGGWLFFLSCMGVLGDWSGGFGGNWLCFFNERIGIFKKLC
jgi:hypothetical protein